MLATRGSAFFSFWYSYLFVMHCSVITQYTKYVTRGKCSCRSIKQANMHKAKALIEKVGTRNLKQAPWSPQQTISDHRLYLSVRHRDALITSADNSCLSPLPFHTALKIPQPIIFTLYQHGSSSQTHQLTHIDKHTHSNTQIHTLTYTHTHTHTRIPQPNTFSLYQHGSPLQTNSLT